MLPISADVPQRMIDKSGCCFTVAPMRIGKLRDVSPFGGTRQTSGREQARLTAALQTLACAVCMAGLTGCASTKAYCVDRGRDALDIFTVVVGVGVGVDARVGPLMQGAYVSKDLTGLQAGEFFWGKDPAWEWLYDDPAVASIVCLGSEVSNISGLSQQRDKAFSTYYRWGVNESLGNRQGNARNMAGQISVALGVGPSLRLGFNWLEALDFVTGWFGFDLMHDDVASQQLKGEKQTKP
jgi:hypothetical protein